MGTEKSGLQGTQESVQKMAGGNGGKERLECPVLG